MKKELQYPYFVWIDLETTGLEPLDHKIIEIATIITDGEFNVIDQNHFQEIIKIDDQIIQEGNTFALDMHRKSGLLDTCKNADPSKTLQNAEDNTIDFIKSIIPEGIKAPLAGNSIGSLDRPFIRVHMKRLESECLHYRNLDISSFTMLAQNMYPDLVMPKKQRNHLAMEDILDSIEELKFLQKNIFKTKLGNKIKNNP